MFQKLFYQNFSNISNSWSDLPKIGVKPAGGPYRKPPSSLQENRTTGCNCGRISGTHYLNICRALDKHFSIVFCIFYNVH